MKRVNYFVGLLAVMILMSSCLLTFYPIYTTKDVVFDAALLGSYANKDPKDGQPDEMHITRLNAAGITIPEGISAIQDKGYLIQFGETPFGGTNGKVTSEFIAFMVVLNNNRYIDFYPYTRNLKDYGAYGYLKVPMHAVYRINMQQGRMVILKRFNQDFLQEMINKRKIRLSHESIDGRSVITASTAELQQYISKYGNQEEAYEKEADTYIKK